MDQNTPRRLRHQTAEPARTALNVLALCFALSVLGRGLGESFTVFLHADLGRFRLGPRRGGLDLFADLAGGRIDRADRSAGCSIASGRARSIRSACSCSGAAFLVASARAAPLAVPAQRRPRRRARHRRRSVTCRIRFCSAAGSARGCRPRWRSSIRRPAQAYLLMLPVSQLLIDRIGWRDAYQLFGIVAMCLLLPLLVLPWRLFATGSPHIAGKPMPASSRTAGRSAARCAITPSGRCSPPSSSPRSAMYAITAQIVAYLIDAGFPPLQAATAWGFTGVALTCSACSRISSLDSVIGRRRSVLVSYGLLHRRPHPALDRSSTTRTSGC